MTAHLPPATSTRGYVQSRCPWCGEDMDEATVRIVDLADAWADEQVDWPERSPCGAALSPLVTDCPSCARPSMVALSEGGARDFHLRLVPVRTPTDARLLADLGEASS